jgi:hypothetical protein
MITPAFGTITTNFIKFKIIMVSKYQICSKQASLVSPYAISRTEFLVYSLP